MDTRITFDTLKKACAGVVFLGFIAALMLCAPAQAQAAQLEAGGLSDSSQLASPVSAQATKSCKFGKMVSGSVTSGTDEIYKFKVGAPGADVNVSVKHAGGDGQSFYAEILNASDSTVWSSSSISSGETAKGSRVFLPKGTYRMRLYSYTGYIWPIYPHTEKFQFKITKASQKLTIGKKSATFAVSSTKDITLKFPSSFDYAKKNLKITKNTNKKVATATIPEFGTKKATLTIKAKKLGKTVLSVKLAGANTVKFTVYVTSNYVFVAKGSKTKLSKPLGVSKVKFINKAKNGKKVAVTTKAGKVTAKKQGRATIAVKKGKITYNYNFIVTNYKTLGRAAYRLAKEYVPNPNTLKVNNVYKGSYKLSSELKVPVVYIDYSYGNETGGTSRNKIIAWYDDALDLQSQNVLTANNVIGKKRMKLK